MERIKQAVEKARKQRPGGANHLIHSYLDNNAATSPHASQATDELGDLSYERTCVVKLEAEHLEKNRIVAFNKSNATSMPLISCALMFCRRWKRTAGAPWRLHRLARRLGRPSLPSIWR